MKKKKKIKRLKADIQNWQRCFYKLEKKLESIEREYADYRKQFLNLIEEGKLPLRRNQN